jgi:hypothetical protein
MGSKSIALPHQMGNKNEKQQWKVEKDLELYQLRQLNQTKLLKE